MSCLSVNGQMNPTARKMLEGFAIQSQFRELYPEKAKAIQGMTVPSQDCESLEAMIIFADEKIRNKNQRIEQQRKYRESIGAPTKKNSYGYFNY